MTDQHPIGDPLRAAIWEAARSAVGKRCTKAEFLAMLAETASPPEFSAAVTRAASESFDAQAHNVMKIVR
jgi:hypothetical protein